MGYADGKCYVDAEEAEYLIREELKKKKIAQLRAEFNRPVGPNESVEFNSVTNPFVTSQDVWVGMFMEDILPETEDSMDKESRELYRQRISEMIKGKNFFDLGCGRIYRLEGCNEWLAQLLAHYGANKYVGVDIDPGSEFCASVNRPEGG